MKKINFNSDFVKGSLCLVLLNLAFIAFSQQYEWAVKEPMPLNSAALSACYYDGKIYAIGGSDGLMYNNEYGNNYFMIYDVATQTWTQGPDLPSPRMMLSAVEAGGKIYAIGGGYPPYLNNINECYDPETGTWTEKTPMPISTSCFAACNVDGLIYTAGGMLSFGKTHCYNPETDEWTVKATMPIPVAGPTGTYLDGKIYVTGGINQNYTNIDKLQIYDVASDTWDATKAPMDTCRFGHSMSVIDNKVIVLGGCVFPENKAMRTVIAYDAEADAWTDMPMLPDSLQWGAVCSFGNKIYIMGGEDKCMMTYSDATIFNYFFELSSSSDINTQLYEPGIMLNTFPNPFANELTVSFKLTDQSQIKLELIDCSGRVIEQYLDDYLQAGDYNYTYQTSEIEAGIYYLSIQGSEIKAVNKVVNIR